MAQRVSILLKNGLLITQDETRRIFEGNLYVEGGRIVEVGGPERSADVEMDASGCLVMPGLINAYTRVAHTLLGLPSDLPEEEFSRRAEELEERVTRRDVQMAAALAAAEMLRSGTTCLLDVFTWEDEVARALTQVHMRGFLAWEVGSSDADVRACEYYLTKLQAWEGVVPLVAARDLRAGKAVGRLAVEHETRWCVPLCETRSEVYRFQKETGMRPVEWLDANQLLTEDLIALHCVWLTLNEIRSLARRRTGAIHCPVSDQMSGVGGPMPLVEMLREGVSVALGTGSPARCGTLDIFQHLRLCGMLHKSHRWDPTVVPAQQLLDLCTVGAAECLGLGGGRLQEGLVADLTVLDPGRRIRTPFKPEEVISYIAYLAVGSQVRHVVVGGTLVVDEGEVETLDVDVLREDVSRLRAELGHENPGH
jgi:5-methylthioadenosine/S-adenosylhomocysteine deaminase